MDWGSVGGCRGVDWSRNVGGGDVVGAERVAEGTWGWGLVDWAWTVGGAGDGDWAAVVALNWGGDGHWCWGDGNWAGSVGWGGGGDGNRGWAVSGTGDGERGWAWAVGVALLVDQDISWVLWLDTWLVGVHGGAETGVVSHIVDGTLAAVGVAQRVGSAADAVGLLLAAAAATCGVRLVVAEVVVSVVVLLSELGAVSSGDGTSVTSGGSVGWAAG